jgi:hypothetical protein
LLAGAFITNSLSHGIEWSSRAALDANADSFSVSLGGDELASAINVQHFVCLQIGVASRRPLFHSPPALPSAPPRRGGQRDGGKDEGNRSNRILHVILRRWKRANA